MSAGARSTETARQATHEATRPAVHELERLRAAIEALDARLVGQIAERVRLARSIGNAKREAGLPTLDPAREAAVVRRAADSARALCIDAEPVRDIFWHLVGLCRRAQQSEDA